MVKAMNSDFQRETSDDAPGSWLTALQAKADTGDADAQFGLGLHHGNAVGDGLNFVQAAQWYRKAADQDHALAQYNLGVMFARGQGMPQNDATSADWMRRAAEGGDAAAQYHLGGRHHRTSLNAVQPEAMEARIEAFKWFHHAAEQGYGESLTARERIAITMTRAEVDEANRRAAAFVVRKPSNPALQ